MEAALSTTNGPSLRCELSCITRATSSLPEPALPRISTRLLVGATRSRAARSWFMAGDLPIISELTTERSRSSRTSRCSLEASSARSVTSSSRSALKGFSM